MEHHFIKALLQSFTGEWKAYLQSPLEIAQNQVNLTVPLNFIAVSSALYVIDLK
jgi:hypothetical protein